jgi:heme/copper-type cytochrome/quinol oxidase subunit 3
MPLLLSLCAFLVSDVCFFDVLFSFVLCVAVTSVYEKQDSLTIEQQVPLIQHLIT